MKTLDRSEFYPPSKENEITVLSWNLLAPTHDVGGLDWTTVRAPALRTWLKRFAECDVICFQEVDRNHSLSDIVECLGAYGFAVVVQERQQGFPVVNATFFKPSRLQVTSSQHRSRALLVNFLSALGQEICIVNVHLDATNENQRRSQLASALKRMHGSEIRIVCGDFNSPISAGSHIQKQLVEAGLVRAPTKGITCYAASIDHIWASECMVPVTILTSSNEWLANMRASGTPNVNFPSDHLPVGSTFRLPLRRLQNSTILGLQAQTFIVDPNIREEWQQILRIGSFCQGRAAVREQKKLEAAFLSAISQEEAMALRDLQQSAVAAAQALIRDAVRQALLSQFFSKPHDPGKQDLCRSTFGGA